MQGCIFTEDLYLIFVGAMVQSEDKRIITVNQIIGVGVFKQVSEGDHHVKNQNFKKVHYKLFDYIWSFTKRHTLGHHHNSLKGWIK